MARSILNKRERETVAALLLLGVLGAVLWVTELIRSVPVWIWWGAGAAVVAIAVGVVVLWRKDRQRF